jgi:hypothetical protein
LGGVVVSEGVHMVDGHSYPERSYGYANLGALAGQGTV